MTIGGDGTDQFEPHREHGKSHYKNKSVNEVNTTGIFCDNYTQYINTV
jgi:hypothetical protein